MNDERKERKMDWVSPRKAAEITGLCQATLRRYAKEGKIPCIRKPDGHRRFDVSAWEQKSQKEEERIHTICYARVSQTKQKEDLERQKEYLLKHYSEGECVTDVGSGLNYKRKGFLSILERAIQGEKLRIVVTYRDRLVRFGFDFIEHIVTKAGGEIVVLNQIDTSPEQELIGDLTAIITVFSSRLHGLRSHKVKAYLTQTNSEAEDNTEGVG